LGAGRNLASIAKSPSCLKHKPKVQALDSTSSPAFFLFIRIRLRDKTRIENETYPIIKTSLRLAACLAWAVVLGGQQDSVALEASLLGRACQPTISVTSPFHCSNIIGRTALRLALLHVLNKPLLPLGCMPKWATSSCFVALADRMPAECPKPAPEASVIGPSTPLHQNLVADDALMLTIGIARFVRCFDRPLASAALRSIVDPNALVASGGDRRLVQEKKRHGVGGCITSGVPVRIPG
jgi:hypothetical protein